MTMVPTPAHHCHHTQLRNVITRVHWCNTALKYINSMGLHVASDASLSLRSVARPQHTVLLRVVLSYLCGHDVFFFAKPRTPTTNRKIIVNIIIKLSTISTTFWFPAAVSSFSFFSTSDDKAPKDIMGAKRDNNLVYADRPITYGWSHRSLPAIARPVVSSTGLSHPHGHGRLYHRRFDSFLSRTAV